LISVFLISVLGNEHSLADNSVSLYPTHISVLRYSSEKYTCSVLVDQG